MQLVTHLFVSKAKQPASQIAVLNKTVLDIVRISHLETMTARKDYEFVFH
jgi:hypothetical protein